MQVQTKNMGTVDVPQEQCVSIPAGLFGFEDYTRFALIESHYKPFFWLQSLEEKSLAFLLIDPFLVCPEYETDIDDKELLKVGIKDASDVLVMTIVTIPQDGTSLTTNLLGPLIINKKNKQAMQVVLNESKWKTKYNIIEALKRKEEA